MITQWEFAKKARNHFGGIMKGNGLIIKPKPWNSDAKVESDGIGYGILYGGMDCIKKTIEEGFRYIYVDGPYWIKAKPVSVRATWNHYQHMSGVDIRGDIRLAGGEIDFVKKRGDAIYLCPNGPIMHREFWGQTVEDWIEETTKEIKKHTDRQIKIRRKGDINNTAWEKREASLKDVAKDAYAAVIAGSSVGVGLLCYGVPVFAMKPCAPALIGTNDLSFIENAIQPERDEVEAWAANLAVRQYSPQDFQSGRAWEILKADLEYVNDSNSLYF